MTTETRNEAADYLRLGMPKPLHAKLGEALAAERRATVERIRVAVVDRTWPVDPFDGEPTASRILAILDEEAAR